GRMVLPLYGAACSDCWAEANAEKKMIKRMAPHFIAKTCSPPANMRVCYVAVGRLSSGGGSPREKTNYVRSNRSDYPGTPVVVSILCLLAVVFGISRLFARRRRAGVVGRWDWGGECDCVSHGCAVRPSLGYGDHR